MRWRLLRAVGGRHQEHGLKNVLPTQKGGLCQSETRGVEEVRLPPLSPHSPPPLSLCPLTISRQWDSTFMSTTFGHWQHLAFPDSSNSVGVSESWKS